MDGEEVEKAGRERTRPNTENPAKFKFDLDTVQGDFCKICHCGPDSPNAPLIAPCFCAGSLKYVHQNCLQRWIKSSDIKKCELCKYPFDMQSKV